MKAAGELLCRTDDTDVTDVGRDDRRTHQLRRTSVLFLCGWGYPMTTERLDALQCQCVLWLSQRGIREIRAPIRVIRAAEQFLEMRLSMSPTPSNSPHDIPDIIRNQ